MHVIYFNFQMTNEAEFSHSIWLILMPNEMPINFFFSELYVPMDSQVIAAHSSNEIIQLTEVYNVHQDFPLQSLHFGEWAPNHGLIATSDSFYARRSNMFGITLNVVTIAVSFM